MTGDDGHMIVHPQYNVGEEGRMIIHPQFNVGEDGRMIIHPQFNVGEDGRMVIEPVFNVGEDGRSIVHPQYNITGSADPGGDDIFMPKPNRGVSLHDSVHCLVGDIGKAPFTTGAGGDSIIHPQFNVGEDGRMIIHPQFRFGEDGRSIVHPQYNVGKDGHMIVHPQYNVGEDGRMIIHPQFNVGEDTIPAGTIIPHEDSHHSAKDLIGNPPEPKIAPPAPHVSDRVAVIDGGSDRIEEVARTSSAPRLAAFARMGR
jgi:hypothetical protein